MQKNQDRSLIKKFEIKALVNCSFFFLVLRNIVHCISTSDVLHKRILINILIYPTDAYIEVMAWVGYARTHFQAFLRTITLDSC